MTDGDTIFATSSGAPPAAIAIVRISGRHAIAIATALAGTLPPPRRAGLRALHDPRDGLLLDRALVLVFPAPRTATGEDVIELHVHGGRAVVTAVETAIEAQPHARRAEAGEFTRRALENGVLDVTEAEGLGDLLAAQTEGQRRAALRIAEGSLRVAIEGWTDTLLGIAARIEAQLDFSDDDDVAAQTGEAIVGDIDTIAIEMTRLLDAPPVERLHDGIRVVIAGPPNSGKSTLLNALTGRDVAIVSPVAGTTRDRIEAGVIRDGQVYLLVDTAGLTATPGDEIEAIGVARAETAIASADIVLWLGDGPGPRAICVGVHARIDLPERERIPADRIGVSARTGVGLDTLWRNIDARAVALLPGADILTTNARQRALLAECLACLGAAASERDLLLVAEELREALKHLDAIVGRSGIEHVLDALFLRFCIGK